MSGAHKKPGRLDSFASLIRRLWRRNRKDIA